MADVRDLRNITLPAFLEPWDTHSDSGGAQSHKEYLHSVKGGARCEGINRIVSRPSHVTRAICFKLARSADNPGLSRYDETNEGNTFDDGPTHIPYALERVRRRTEHRK